MDRQNISTKQPGKRWFPSGCADRETALDWAGQDLFGRELWAMFRTKAGTKTSRWRGSPDGKRTVRVPPSVLWRKQFEAAEGHLRTKCEDGTIKVIELSPQGDREYRSTIWRSDRHMMILRIGRSADGHYLGFVLPVEHEKEIATDDPAADGPNAKSTSAGRLEAQKWLEGLMLQHGKVQPKRKKKSDLRKKAKSKFSVSGRQFDRAWQDAIEKTGATSWSRTGPLSH